MQKTRYSIPAKAIAAFTAGMLAAPIAVAVQYDYQLVSDGTDTAAQAFAINDPGEVTAVGWIYSTKDGTLTAVAPAASGDAGAIGINDAGDITGSVLLSGLIRSKHGEDTIFMYPGETIVMTQGRGINNKGVVAGIYSTVSATGPFKGFVYDSKSGEFTNIDAPSSTSTFPHGINSKGEVVGDALYFNTAVDPCGGTAGTRYVSWLRTKKGAMIYFQVNGQPRTRVRGINDAGQVVGMVGPNGLSGKGFVIDAPETSCQTITVNSLLEYPGATHTWPEGITNSGDIVGIFTADVFSTTSGFLATPQVQ